MAWRAGKQCCFASADANDGDCDGNLVRWRTRRAWRGFQTQKKGILARFGVHSSSVVQLRHCDGVRLTGNTLIAPGPLEKLAFDTDFTVTDLTGGDGGIAVAALSAKIKK